LSALVLYRSAVEKIVSSHDIVVTDINIVEGSICRTDRSEKTEEGVEIVSAFRERGSLGPTSECRRVPQPRWVEREGEREGRRSEAVGDRRERGENPAAFVFVPRPGRVRLE
jgi:hypothetical protein